MGNKIRATIPAGSYVAGKPEPDSDGMVSVVTDDGRKGKINAANLEKTLDTPTKEALSPSKSDEVQAVPIAYSPEGRTSWFSK